MFPDEPRRAENADASSVDLHDNSLRETPARPPKRPLLCDAKASVPDPNQSDNTQNATANGNDPTQIDWDRGDSGEVDGYGDGSERAEGDGEVKPQNSD